MSTTFRTVHLHKESCGNAPQHRTGLVIWWCCLRLFGTISGLFGTVLGPLALKYFVTIRAYFIIILVYFITIRGYFIAIRHYSGLLGGCPDEFRLPQSCMPTWFKATNKNERIYRGGHLGPQNQWKLTNSWKDMFKISGNVFLAPQNKLRVYTWTQRACKT